MEKLVITITCDSTMSYPRNPHNPKGIDAQAEEYIRSVNAGASICHLHGPYTVDEKIQADGTKLSDLYLPGWLELTTKIKAKVKPVIQFGIANGRFPQRVELMKQRPDMMSICFNAHERLKQTEGEEDDRIDPSVGANMMPSVASFLNGAVSIIGNTFIREKVDKEKNRTVQYCMRIGPHAYYAAKVRRPVDAGPVPDYIVNPTFEKLLKISKGESATRVIKRK